MSLSKREPLSDVVRAYVNQAQGINGEYCTVYVLIVRPLYVIPHSLPHSISQGFTLYPQSSVTAVPGLAQLLDTGHRGVDTTTLGTNNSGRTETDY